MDYNMFKVEEKSEFSLTSRPLQECIVVTRILPYRITYKRVCPSKDVYVRDHHPLSKIIALDRSAALS